MDDASAGFCATPDLLHDFGYRTLGPIVADYCGRLLTHLVTFERERDAKCLYVARAGVRIRQCLERFANTAELELPLQADTLWASRLMVAKGIWLRNQKGAVDLLTREFAHSSTAEFVTAMLRYDDPRSVDLTHPDLGQKGVSIPAFLSGANPAAKVVNEHLAIQARLFEECVKRLIGEHERVVLVDTGWQGTSQLLLQDSFPEFEWWGAYFGRFATDKIDRRHWNRAIGIVTEHERFDPIYPESCVVLHRHLIEDLFQPRGPSIERLERRPTGEVFAPEAELTLADTGAEDSLFAGVMAYLAELPGGSGPGALRSLAQQAWSHLARFVALPTRDEALLFSGVKRSADFGRPLEVPLLLPARNRHAHDSAEARVRDSLWPSGQLAIEYSPDVAEPLQRKLAGLGRGGLKPAQQARGATWLASRPATVAIITRTLDRPLFLERALKSVAAQTYKDYVHVIVNDGGDVSAVRATIEQFVGDTSRILLVDNVVNRGMEAASNIGISKSTSDFIVIHDDDDTWEPEFLAETVSFLQGPKGALYDGVITRTTYVSESITPEGITRHGAGPYNDWIATVHLYEMAVQNFFPPISFVFRRSRWEALGGFDERYPVLGDWDFNLRFLCEADIGVLPRALANYHHRDRGDTTLFGNSVIADRDKHVEYSPIVRNNLVRYLNSKGRVAEASLVGLGVLLGEDRDLGRRTLQRIEELAKGQKSAALEPARHANVGNGVRPNDELWIASQRLSRAFAIGDVGILADLGLSPDPGDFRQRVLRVAAKLLGLPRPTFGGRFGTGDVSFTAEMIDKLVKLHRDPYKDVPPPPDFDELKYLHDNPDVAAAVARGEVLSGFVHYYFTGRSEGRPRPTR